MRVAFIHPPNVYAPSGILLVSIPPIGLAYVAGATERAGYAVQVIDAVGTYFDQEYRVVFAGSEFHVNGATPVEIRDALHAETDVIAVTCMFMHHWPIVRTVVAACRARFPHAVIVLGGEQVTGLPEYSLEDSLADVVVLGEGEETMVALLDALRDGAALANVEGLAFREGDGFVRTRRRDRMRTVPAAHRPAWHLFPVTRYMDRRMFHGPSVGRSMPIMATRGCPYRCTFCTSPNMWTTRYVTRPPAEVVDEMADYRRDYGATDFQFVDLTAVVKRSWILEFCAELERRGWPEVRWQLPSGTRSEAIDAEVAAAMKRSGCHILTYAPESGAESTLARIKKRIDKKKMLASIRAVRDAGLEVECFMILGFPDESLGEVLETLRFAVELAWAGVESVPFSGYRPVPGTELSDGLVASGALVYDDEVFMDLVRSAALFGGRSYNPAFSDAQIALFRLAGSIAFFGTSYARRPWRLLRVLRNVATDTQTTKFERALREAVDRALRSKTTRSSPLIDPVAITMAAAGLVRSRTPQRPHRPATVRESDARARSRP